jgi:hypothetical protein
MTRRETLVSALLVFCVVLIALWEIAASRRSLQPFSLNAASLEGFEPSSSSWSLRSLPTSPDPLEPNIFMYELRSRSNAPTPLQSTVPVLVRLVHGYNMPDCMRIKGYQVKLLEDRRHFALQKDIQRPGKLLPEQMAGPGVQIWRLTSSVGDVSIWVTGMLSAGDFSETDTDIRSMAFPRVGIPDDPRWLPKGITLASLRHPVRNFNLVLRSKWNSSRCDLATFLKLKQPAWASEELLTIIAVSQHTGTGLSQDQEHILTGQTVDAYSFILTELQEWGRRNRSAVLKDMDKRKAE